jgi:hypothetical protein
MINTLRILTMLAWRNLWRNHRRTLIMLGAVIVGVWAMIFMTALTMGMVNDMIEDSISVLPGHVQVHHPDYLDDPNITNLLPMPDDAIEEQFGSAGFLAWATRIKVPAVVSSERESRGVTLLGIDPQREEAMSFVDYAAMDGRFLEGPDDEGLVIGRKLAETLETELGKRVVLMSQDPDNDIADRGFRVVGLFSAEPFAGRRSRNRDRGARRRLPQCRAGLREGARTRGRRRNRQPLDRTRYLPRHDVARHGRLRNRLGHHHFSRTVVRTGQHAGHGRVRTRA